MKTFPQTVEPDQALADLPIERLLDRTVAIKATIKKLDEDLASLQEELISRVKAGELDHTFSHNDHAFNLSDGKASWTYPATVLDLDRDLKSAKKAAQANGSAIKTLGAPFWTIKPPKP